MSEARTTITANMIRKGDLIRAEMQEGARPLHTAFDVSPMAMEFVASRDGYGLSDGYDKYANLYLLARPVVLQTAPYSVIAPPESDADRRYPFILDRSGSGDTWRNTKNGDSVNDSEVIQLVREGWRIIESKEG